MFHTFQKRKEIQLTGDNQVYHVAFAFGIHPCFVLFYINSCLERANDTKDRGVRWIEENKTGSVGVLFVRAKASQA